MRPIAIFATILATQLLSQPASAQVQAPPRGPEVFASENAILDTSLPFAIGAREAQQALRGSFGWPTFQEGLVEGVYFRFDPDGYARFSPSPRLDTDVFEVICRPRTYACEGRKDSMSMMLTNRGQLQLKFEDVAEGDAFYVSEGVSEIQVPPRILQPLDHQLEALLSTGGELMVRRGDQTIANVSLRGFSAVSTYLRWVLARQDYTVMPRGWPVPNSKNSQGQGDMTRPASWQSPMPQPQVIAGGGFAAQNPPVYSPNSPQSTASYPTADSRVNEEVAEVRGELKLMRELLLQREQQIAGMTGNTDDWPTSAAPSSDPALAARLQNLQTVAEEIRAEIEALQQAGGAAAYSPPAVGVFSETGTAPTGAEMQSWAQPGQAGQSGQLQLARLPASGSDTSSQGADFARQLAYLIEVIGLAPETALAVLREREESPAAAPTVSPPAPPAQGAAGVGAGLYQGDVVSEILRELEAELGVTPAAEPDTAPMPAATEQEYQLLSDYFKSAVLPDLVPPQ